jgi:ELWxxDGT repeat protein
MSILVGDTLYFNANDGSSGHELWAHDTSNASTWRVADIYSGSGSSSPGNYMEILVGDTLYISASDGSSGQELWAHDTSNASTWQVADIRSGSSGSFPGQYMEILVGDTLYFSANDGTSGWELWAHDTSNASTWRVADINSGIGSSYPGQYMEILVGDTIYFDADDGSSEQELWAHDTSNASTWRVADINSGASDSDPGQYMEMLVGDTLYFSANDGSSGHELWAHDTSNASTWRAADIRSGSSASLPGHYMSILVGDTLYFDAVDGSSGHELWAHRPSEITSLSSGSGSGSGSGSSSSSSFAYANNKLSAGNSGSRFTCAILDNGDLKCWGRDSNGELGDGGSNTNTNAPSSTAIDLGTGRTAVSVAGGSNHVCAILDNGDLKCWGYDNFGQLGDGGTNTGTNAPSSTAIDLGTGRTAVAVDAGEFHTCAILDNGDMKCWGRDNNGQLGDGGSNTNTNTPSSTAIDLGPGRTAVAVATGTSHTCAILDNGDLKCWGADDHGKLGDGGTNTEINAPSSTAIDLGTGRTAVAVSADSEHTCAILDNGEAKCWGRDRYGQLGDGGTSHSSTTHLTAPSSTAINLGTGRTAVAVDTGRYHSCALLDNGDVKCWGHDYNGQLGDGGFSTDTYAPSSTAIDLGTGRTAVAISAGYAHTCAILDNGDMKCWGHGLDGQLGNGGTNSDQQTPVLVSGSNTWDSSTVPSSGSGSGMTNVTGATCTVSPSLPTGLSIDSSTCTISGTPTVETSNTTYTITAVISGTTFQTSVWLSTAPYGTITSAVEGAALNLGEAMTPITLNYTVNANGGGSASSSSFAYANDKVSAGYYHTCAILDNGDMKCWGRNSYGQLGDGNSANLVPSPTSTAIDLGTGRTAVAVSAGYHHTCAILDNGDLKCWGYDGNGELGDGGSNTNTNAPSSTAIDLGTGRTAVAVSAGNMHTCVILDNGDVKCWGADTYGQLGDGGSNTNTNAPSSTAIDLGTGRTAVAVAAGDDHTCAILDNGDLKCWGRDSNGQLGDGGSNTNTNAPSSTAIDLGTGRTAVAVSAGEEHTCAILDNGDMKCWGRNNYGQLGDGSNVNTNAPSSTAINLGTGRTAVAVSAGEEHTCAILDNGDLKCWGRDSNGQLGDGGSNTNTNAPSSTAIDLGTGRTAVAVSAGESTHLCHP